jgi:hypothetical protein
MRNTLHRRHIDDFSKYELYDLFRIRDCLQMLHEDYGLADEELLAEVKRVIEEKV